MITVSKTTLAIALCATGLSFVTAGCKPSADTTATNMESSRLEVDKDVTKFFTEAAQNGAMEIKLAELAATYASSAEIKEFAGMMLSEHEANNKMLMSLASQKKISLPAALDDKALETIEDLQEQSGVAFDKAYSKQMVVAHEDMIDLLEDAGKNSKDGDVRTFALQTLPAIQHHLQMAQALKSET